MNGRDQRLGQALRNLDVPPHGSDFHERLARRLDQEPARHGMAGARPTWLRAPMLLGVVAAAAVLVAVLAMSTMIGRDRPDVLVEVGGGTIPAATTVPTLASPPVTAPSTKPTTPPASSSAVVPPATTSTTRPGMTGLTAASTLDVGGLGPVRVGMTPDEATVAAGVPIVASGTALCSYATATGGPAGVAFMLADGRIARVEVRPGSPVKTLSGAGIGDTEAEVQARYSNVLEVIPDKYVRDGHNLTLVPTDPADKDYRLIFETDGSKVTRFQSGKLPEVAFVEGCG